MQPKLSVVIPVYNTEQYLKECLDSVINQTLKEIEIIIVYDYSIDESEKIIQEYMQKDNRILCIKQKKSLGLGGARNAGISQSQGEWLTFVDSDDWIETDCYENMLQLIQTYNAQLGMFSVIKFDDTTKTEFFDDYYSIKLKNPEKLTSLNLASIASPAWNKMYKLADIKTNKITFPEQLKHEDEEFWFKYATKIKPLTVADKRTYYHYRQRNNSLSATLALSQQDLPQVLINIWNFLVAENLQNEYRSSFFRLFWNIDIYHQLPNTQKVTYHKKMYELFKMMNMSIHDLEKIDATALLFFISPDHLKTTVKYLSSGQLPYRYKMKKNAVSFCKKLKIYSVTKKIYQKVRKK